MAYFTSGDIAVGTRLPAERQLAASLGVGRSAVREALAALEILGIVIVRPGSGTYLRDGVSELLPRTLSWGLMLGEPRTRELVELRERPGGSGRPACCGQDYGRGPGPDARQSRLHGEEPGRPGDIRRIRRRLPPEIATSSGNQVLQELLQSIRSLLRIWVDRALTDEGHAAAALAEHRTIFEALASHDAGAVTNAMASHMNTASRRLLAGYDAAQ